MHPAIDILAGIPSVVYGLWGVLVIVPFIANDVAPLFGVRTMDTASSQQPWSSP